MQLRTTIPAQRKNRREFMEKTVLKKTFLVLTLSALLASTQVAYGSEAKPEAKPKSTVEKQNGCKFFKFGASAGASAMFLSMKTNPGLWITAIDFAVIKGGVPRLFGYYIKNFLGRMSMIGAPQLGAVTTAAVAGYELGEIINCVDEKYWDNAVRNRMEEIFENADIGRDLIRKRATASFKSTPSSPSSRSKPEESSALQVCGQ